MFYDLSDFELLQECKEILKDEEIVIELLSRFENRIKYDVIKNKLYSMDEVAGIFGVSTKTIERKLKNKELTYFKTGLNLVTGEVITKYLESKKVKGKV